MLSSLTCMGKVFFDFPNNEQFLIGTSLVMLQLELHLKCVFKYWAAKNSEYIVLRAFYALLRVAKVIMHDLISLSEGLKEGPERDIVKSTTIV